MDDLMPTDGEQIADLFQPEIEEEVKQAENRERAMIQGAEPLMEDLLAWFDAQITQATSVDSIDPSAKQSIETQLIAQKLLKDKLFQTKVSLEILRNKYKS